MYLISKDLSATAYCPRVQGLVLEDTSVVNAQNSCDIQALVLFSVRYSGVKLPFCFKV